MAARRPSEPQIQKLDIQKQVLHIAESASFLDPPSGEMAIAASDLTLSSASSPVERKKRFRLPKIVLQDKKRPDFDVKSCIEIDPQIPKDDAEIHEQEVQCCPPCDSQDGKGSKYIVERSDWTSLLKAEPGDLACFLAGCSPGVSVCEKHHRQRGAAGGIPESPKERQFKEDLKRAAQEIARDSSKGSGTHWGIKSKPILADNRGSDGYNTTSRNSPLNSPSRVAPSSTGLKFNSEAPSNGKKRSSIVIMSSQVSEQESSVTSGSDAFPHATNSMELGAGKTELLSTSVVTNFTLGGVKSKTKHKIAKEATRKRRSLTRSQGSVDIPEPLRLGQNRGYRSGSVGRAREGLERRSKSEGPPSSPQPSPRDTGRTWEDSTLSQLLGTPGKDLVRSMEQIAPDYEKNDDAPQAIPKGRLRSMKDETRSTLARQSIASNLSRTDDTAPTEVSVRNINNRDTRAASPETVRIRTNDSQQYLTKIGGKPQADGAGGSKSKPPSFVSSRSKALLSKHDLLKPCIAESQQLDTGLPLPPILTPVPVVPEILMSGNPTSTDTLNIISDRGKEKVIPDRGDLMCSVKAVNNVVGPGKPGREDQLPEPIVKDLANIKKAQDLVDGVRGRLQKAEVQMIQAMNQETSGNKMSADKLLATYSKVKPEPLEVDSSQQVTTAVEAQPLQSLQSALSTELADGGHPVSPAAQETLNAAYWGFVPAIKEAVQDVVKVAVRNAVKEATIAAVTKKDDSRLSMLEPQEPPKKPNEKLQRTSVREIPPTSQRDSESTVVRTLPMSSLDPSTGKPTEPPVKDLSRSQNETRNLQSLPCESIISKCQENESNKGTLKLASIGSSTGNDQLETVPLDDSISFVAGGKNGSALVPPRRSSKNKALVSKIKTSLSTGVTISPKPSTFPQNVSKYQGSCGSRALRSNSSEESLEAIPRVKDKDKEAEAPLIKQFDEETTYPINKLSRANTVHWLKELLSNNGPYEPQFTALPPRMQKDKDKAILKAKIRSGKQPDKAVAEEYKTLPLGPVVARPKTVASKRGKRAEASEVFTQTINDLEMLMNEALQIARQAADTQDAPNALGNAAKILRSDRERSEEELRARYQAKPRRDDRESFPSVHESLMSFSDSEASEMTEDTEFRCPRPPTPPITRQTATLKFEASAAETRSKEPEIINSPNLYPQQSQTLFSDLPVESSKKSADNIKSADPRSMPLESQISDRRTKRVSPPTGSRNLTIAVESRSSSKREAELDNYEAYSDSEIAEPPPEFKALEFSRGRATTLRTLGSDRSPRRLSPVKTYVPQKEETFQDPNTALLDTSGEPRIDDYSDPLPRLTPQNMSARKCEKGHSEEVHQTVATKLALKSVPGKRQVRDYILDNRSTSHSREESSRNLRQRLSKTRRSPGFAPARPQ